MNTHCGDKVMARDVGGKIVHDAPRLCGDCSQHDAHRMDGCGTIVDKDPNDPANLQPGDDCPNCDGRLMAGSPSGNGRIACDECQTYWN